MSTPTATSPPPLPKLQSDLLESSTPPLSPQLPRHDHFSHTGKVAVEPMVHFLRSGGKQGGGRALELCMPVVTQLAMRLACEDTVTACRDLSCLLTALLDSAPSRMLVENVLPMMARMLRGDQG